MQRKSWKFQEVDFLPVFFLGHVERGGADFEDFIISWVEVKRGLFYKKGVSWVVQIHGFKLLNFAGELFFGFEGVDWLDGFFVELGVLFEEVNFKIGLNLLVLNLMLELLEGIWMMGRLR